MEIWCGLPGRSLLFSFLYLIAILISVFVDTSFDTVNINIFFSWSKIVHMLKHLMR